MVRRAECINCLITPMFFYVLKTGTSCRNSRTPLLVTFVRAACLEDNTRALITSAIFCGRAVFFFFLLVFVSKTVSGYSPEAIYAITFFPTGHSPEYHFPDRHLPECYYGTRMVIYLKRHQYYTK